MDRSGREVHRPGSRESPPCAKRPLPLAGWVGTEGRLVGGAADRPTQTGRPHRKTQPFLCPGRKPTYPRRRLPMIRLPCTRTAVSACFAAFALIGSADAFAQAPPLSEAIVIGGWTFRPSLEARIRGEYRRDAFQLNSRFRYDNDAVLADGLNSNLPGAGAIIEFSTAPTDAWLIAERFRLGLAVDRGPVTAVLKLQDARAFGGSGLTLSSGVPATAPGVGFAPYEAYLDLHSRTGRPMFLRVGRQAVKWGDGRLIGTNDFTATGRALDAARFGAEVGDFDIEALAALLGYPYFGGGGAGALGGLNGLGASPSSGATGAQLYGLKIAGHFLPLLHIEATALARITRPPTFGGLTPSDTFVFDGRLFGDYRGFHYSLEGAYQLGQVASFGKNRSLEAPAFAGRLEWETALPWHLTFGAQGAYASGDKGADKSTADDPITRFDPILPDETSNHSKMSLYAWSNLIEAGGDLSVRPIEEVAITGGYRFVGLAEPKGRWVTGALTTVGADPNNTSILLGHEIDAVLRITPWDPITIQGGYGLFLLGDGGKKILAASSNSTAEMQHWGYLQATVKAP